VKRIFIGYDSRAPLVHYVAARSLQAASAHKHGAEPIVLSEMMDRRLLWRPYRERDGQLHDLLSGAPMSTEFAISRFLVPFLCRDGWALFTDHDVVFLGDVDELFDLRDPQCAVMVVKHEMAPTGDFKMGGQRQVPYSRKNWSSVALWNCGHPAHLRLSLAMVNQYPGDLLHRFCWLRDSEIGTLPPSWNWLVNAQPKPEPVKLAHFTLGGPWIEGWEPAPHDEIWTSAAQAETVRVVSAQTRRAQALGKTEDREVT
jgi:hypothetical protein